MHVETAARAVETSRDLPASDVWLLEFQEFKQKQARGGGSGRKRGMGMFTSINNASTETCLDAVRYDAIA